jgi:zinc D-Ala-D-Ala dipeptidase
MNIRHVPSTVVAPLAILMFVSILNADLVELIRINPRIKLDIRYATTNNFAHRKVYPSSHCFLQEKTAKKLALVQQELEKTGLGLKVFDGYRPLSIQKLFWNFCPDKRYVANPKKGSKHNRGSAVDLTLIDLKTGNELVMPSAYDDLSKKAHRVYTNMSLEAAKNCKLLESVMVKHGFIPLPTEWWHFNDTKWKKYPITDISFERLLHR